MGRIGEWFGKLLAGPEVPDSEFMTPVLDQETLHDATTADVAFLYKHSPICHLSAMAFGEIQKFVTTDPGVPVFVVDVLHNRDIAYQIERDLGIRHESPQLILLQNGSPLWNESHWGIKAKAMTEAIEKLET